MVGVTTRRTKHQYALQSEKLPFMLVRTSKVIEMRFRDWPNERGYVRVTSQLVLNSRERFLIHQPNFEIIKAQERPMGLSLS
jgi:hypothetical protein